MVCFLHFLKRLHQESEEGDLAGAMASYQTDIFNGKNLRDGDSDLKHRQSSLYSMLLNCEISNISVECSVALKIALLYRFKRLTRLIKMKIKIPNRERERENSWRVMKFPQRLLHGYFRKGVWSYLFKLLYRVNIRVGRLAWKV